MITVKGTIAVQLDCDQTAKITLAELKDCLKSFQKDFAHEEPNIFVFGDVEADKAEIQRHIDALDLIIAWYHDPMADAE